LLSKLIFNVLSFLISARTLIEFFISNSTLTNGLNTKLNINDYNTDKILIDNQLSSLETHKANISYVDNSSSSLSSQIQLVQSNVDTVNSSLTQAQNDISQRVLSSTFNTFTNTTNESINTLGVNKLNVSTYNEYITQNDLNITTLNSSKTDYETFKTLTTNTLTNTIPSIYSTKSELSTSLTNLKDEILGGVGTAYDTLQELAIGLQILSKKKSLK
jgi:hypothetical protein